MKFANAKLNLMTLEQIKELQEKKLKKQLIYCYDNSDYYRNKFNEIGAQPEDIRTLEDFKKLPILMSKEEEEKSQQESMERFGHPFGMHLCARLEEIELTSTTSGTTGIPTFTYTFSKRDINGPVADLWAFMFKYINTKPGDRVLFAYALGVYATSMILWGIRKVSAIPIDVDVRGGTDQIFQFAELTKPVSALMTPSLADFLIKIAPHRIGKKIDGLGIKYLLLCGEPGAGNLELKKRLESAYGARVYDFWAPGGLGFGLSCNSDEYQGLHCYAPDYNLYQDDLIDPVTKEPIDILEGSIGEAVHTSLDRDASPMIRYAFGDIVQVFTNDCPACGFKGKRLKFLGRSDDMLIAKGHNIYPNLVKEILSLFIPKVTGEIRILLDEPPPKITPPLKVKVEYGSGMDQNQLTKLEAQIKSALFKKIKMNIEITWVPPNSFERLLQKRKVFEKLYE